MYRQSSLVNPDSLVLKEIVRTNETSALLKHTFVLENEACVNSGLFWSIIDCMCWIWISNAVRKIYDHMHILTLIKHFCVKWITFCLVFFNLFSTPSYWSHIAYSTWIWLRIVIVLLKHVHYIVCFLFLLLECFLCNYPSNGKECPRSDIFLLLYCTS